MNSEGFFLAMRLKLNAAEMYRVKKHFCVSENKLFKFLFARVFSD